MTDTKQKTPWNPSKKAISRVKDALPIPCECRYCGGEVTVQKNSKIYGGREYGEYPWVYLCSSCGASVGIHPYTNIPLGLLADRATKSARKKAKNKFNELLKKMSLHRSSAYKLLADSMGIPERECHFGWFDIERCNNAKAVLDRLLSEGGRNE